MTAHPDDAARVDDAELEALLADALTARAGGPVVDGAPAPEDRLVAIEAGVATGTPSRRPLALAAASAVLVVVLLVAVGRGSDDSRVDLRGDATTTTGGDPGPPGSGPPDPGPTSVVEVPGTDGPAVPGDAGSTTTTVALDTRIGDVDLRNFTYPNTACSANVWSLNGPMPGTGFTLVDGAVEIDRVVEGHPAQGYVVWLVDVVHGDVTGDGEDDAIVRLSCGLDQSDGVWESIAIVSVVDGTPTVIGSLDRSGYAPMQSFTDPSSGEVREFPEHELIVDISTDDGELVVRWNRTPVMDPLAAQRLSTVRYRWDGSSFVPQGETDVEVIPAPSQEVVPVEEVDFSSIWLDLQHIRPIENTVCGWAYRDVDVANSALVDWVAPVVDVTHARVGTVTMELVTIANFDRDAESEALVRFTCEGPGPTVHTLGVYEAGVPTPYLRWTTTVEASSFDDVSRWEAHPGQDCVLRVFFRSSTGPSGELVMDYRPIDGGRFERVPMGSCAPPT